MVLFKKIFGSDKKNEAEINLFEILRKNDIDSYYKLIEKANLNSLDDYERNALFAAIVNANTAKAIDLISRDIEINLQDSNGQTPLHFCASHANFDIAKAVLEKGANVNTRDKYGNNALQTAVFNGQRTKYYDIVKLFLRYNADANNINNASNSPLDFANQIGYVDLIELLEGHIK